MALTEEQRRRIMPISYGQLPVLCICKTETWITVMLSMWTLQSIPHPHFPLYTFPPFTCFPFTRFPLYMFPLYTFPPFSPFPLFCTLHIILLSLLLYHEEYHSLPFTNHHFPLYMSLHILLLIMRCEFRFGNLQEENQCKFKSNDPNAIESVNISPELRSLAQPMLHEHFLVIR